MAKRKAKAKSISQQEKELGGLRKKRDALYQEVIDREIALAVVKANHDGS